MRAMVLERSPGRLMERELRAPTPGGGELLVDVAACGICALRNGEFEGAGVLVPERA